MFPVTVNLTPAECMQAATCGIQRQIRALSAHYQSIIVGTNQWVGHIEGAGGELAAAKALGAYWPASIDSFKEPDFQFLGHGIEVKTNLTRPADGDLMVHANIPPHPRTVFVLVLGKMPTFNVMGWIWGAELGPYKRTLSAGHDVFCVPPAKLNQYSIPDGRLGADWSMTDAIDF